MTGHIFFEGEVGAEVTTKSIRADIANYPHATDWTVHFNSGGGDVDEGYAIGAILKGLSKTTALIGSTCASIATYAAHCCTHVIMGPAGDFTIHLPTGTIGGNAEDHRRAAARLDRIKAELVGLYMKRVGAKGITSEEVSAMIDKETSMSPSEALAKGFVDDVQEKLKAVAKININMENTLTKEEAQGFFKSLGDKLDKFMGKFRNAVQIALADGTMATSDAATPEALVGSVIVDANGQPLVDGQYETADGYTVTITGGKVETYEPLMADKKDDVAALKQQVADLTAQLAAKSNESNQAVQAKAKVEATFQAELKNLKTELETLKTKTFGDDSAPDRDTKFKDKGADQIFDPMAELGDSYISSRPSLFNK